ATVVTIRVIGDSSFVGRLSCEGDVASTENLRCQRAGVASTNAALGEPSGAGQGQSAPPLAGNWQQRNSSTVLSARTAGHVTMSLRVRSGAPVSGHTPHQVTTWLPGLGSQVPATQVFPSCTVPLRFVVQSVRSTARVHWFPWPVRQQNGGLGFGSRLPHFFCTSTCFFSSAFASLPCTIRSARQLACVPPARPHFSSVFNRVMK